MIKKQSILGIAVLGVLFSGVEAVLAESVSDADLRGKKICWNNGVTSSYNKDGSFVGNMIGHGTWSLNGDLLTVSAEHGSGANAITKEGGTFHIFRKGRHGVDIDSWGKYCG